MHLLCHLVGDWRSVEELVAHEEATLHERAASPHHTGGGGWQHLAMQLALERLSDAPFKGVSVAAHRKFVGEMLETYCGLWAECPKLRWANQRPRLYGGTKRVFTTFLNRVPRGGRPW